METEHTPGPWFVNPLGLTAHQLAVGTDETFVANCGVGDGSPNEKAANARLIAAAPDLLEAFQRIAAIADKEPSNLHEAQVLRYSSWAFDIARAAIAKATEEE